MIGDMKVRTIESPKRSEMIKEDGMEHLSECHEEISAETVRCEDCDGRFGIFKNEAGRFAAAFIDERKATEWFSSLEDAREDLRFIESLHRAEHRARREALNQGIALGEAELVC